jgi:short-subunit dehydrogenase
MARDPNPQRIWLTGATSGIGEALARRLLDDGHRVALTSRGKAGLERLAKARRCRRPPHASTRPSTASTW